MLRKNYNEDLVKLDNLEKTYQLVKNRAETIRQQFLNREIYEDTIEGEKLGKELDTANELEEFLNDEVVTFARDKDFKVLRDKKLGAWENHVADILFGMIKEDKRYYYDKYKDDDRLHKLYLNSMSIYDKILDVAHFKELLIYLDNEKYIEDVKTSELEENNLHRNIIELIPYAPEPMLLKIRRALDEIKKINDGFRLN